MAQVKTHLKYVWDFCVYSYSSSAVVFCIPFISEVDSQSW